MTLLLVPPGSLTARAHQLPLRAALPSRARGSCSSRPALQPPTPVTGTKAQTLGPFLDSCQQQEASVSFQPCSEGREANQRSARSAGDLPWGWESQLPPSSQQLLRFWGCADQHDALRLSWLTHLRRVQQRGEETTPPPRLVLPPSPSPAFSQGHGTSISHIDEESPALSLILANDIFYIPF